MNKFERVQQKAQRRREGRINRPWRVFLPWVGLLTEDTVKALQKLKAPATLCGRECPANLQSVTYGSLCAYSEAGKQSTYPEVVNAICAELVGATPAEVYDEKTVNVLGAVIMVQNEMARIGRLFEQVKSEPDSDERAAGVEALQFGPFGVADWYARRMGITDHEEVFRTPWARIWQCLKMDKEQGEFERRLRKVYERKNKKKSYGLF